MKAFTKKFLLFATLCVVTLGVVAFAACEKGGGNNGGDNNDGPDPNAFTVYVVDENGAPYTETGVQMCELGEGAMCYATVPVDANGKAVITPPTDSTRLAVHLLGHPDYMVYEDAEMNRGEEITITIREHLPKSGTGTGTVSAENAVTMDAYTLETGSYRFTLASTDDYLFVAYTPAEGAGDYRVRSTGDGMDTILYAVTGNAADGYTLIVDDDYYIDSKDKNTHDDRSATNKNFQYDFAVEDTVYFAIKVKDAASAGKEFILTFIAL